jgi:hypothetical protein
VEEVFAIPFLFTKEFIKDDLPTLERPIKAYSGILSSGHFK